MSVKQVDITIDEDFGNLEDVILSIKTEWRWELVKMKWFTSGITNKIVGFYHQEDTEWNDMILVRRYGEGTDQIIDRNAELRNMSFLHTNGVGTPVYCALNNGLAYGFIPGKTLDVRTVKDESIYPRVAEAVAKMHRLDVNECSDFKSEPFLFPKLQKLANNLPEKFSKPEHQSLFSKTSYDRKNLLAEIERLKALVEKNALPIFSFAHNDLLLQNVIYNSKSDTVNFIDFEYGEYNYSLYDIGDHFVEMCGVEEVDFSLHPDKEFQFKWLTAYFRAKGMEKENITSEFLQKMYDQVNMFAMISHFFWGTWALFQAEHSSIDFEFLEYGIMKLDEYFKRKAEFFAFTQS